MSPVNQTCPQCGSGFTTSDRKRMFCSAPCQTRFHDVNRKRGVVALPLLQAWRAGKSAKKGTPKAETAAYAFGQLCALADQWNAEDRDAQRDPALSAERKRRECWVANDRGVA